MRITGASFFPMEGYPACTRGGGGGRREEGDQNMLFVVLTVEKGVVNTF